MRSCVIHIFQIKVLTFIYSSYQEKKFIYSKLIKVLIGTYPKASKGEKRTSYTNNLLKIKLTKT